MKAVMDRKVTKVLREAGDYFAVLTEEGMGYGALGNWIFHTQDEVTIDTLTQAAKLEDDIDFEDAIDLLILKNSPNFSPFF